MIDAVLALVVSVVVVVAAAVAAAGALCWGRKGGGVG